MYNVEIVDYFSLYRHGDFWPTFIENYLDIRQPIRILDLGTHAGGSAKWIAENLLVNTESRLDTVGLSAAAVHRTAQKILEPYQQVKIFRQSIQQFLSEVAYKYDLVYVDAAHNYTDTLFIGERVLHIVNAPGLVIFDDYVLST